MEDSHVPILKVSELELSMGIGIPGATFSAMFSARVYLEYQVSPHVHNERTLPSFLNSR